MKRRTFYHLSLLLPYIVLVISLAVAFLTGAIDDFFSSPSALGVFAGVVAFFAFSGILWGPLYTWMVIVMLIWSRGRNTDDIRFLYFLSPVLLACSMGIPAISVSLPTSIFFLIDGFLRINNLGFVSSVLLKDMDQDMFFGVSFSWAFMAVICLVVGYAFVGVVVWIEHVLTRRGFFKDETDILLAEPALQNLEISLEESRMDNVE